MAKQRTPPREGPSPMEVAEEALAELVATVFPAVPLASHRASDLEREALEYHRELFERGGWRVWIERLAAAGLNIDALRDRYCGLARAAPVGGGSRLWAPTTADDPEVAGGFVLTLPVWGEGGVFDIVALWADRKKWYRRTGHAEWLGGSRVEPMETVRLFHYPLDWLAGERPRHEHTRVLMGAGACLLDDTGLRLEVFDRVTFICDDADQANGLQQLIRAIVKAHRPPKARVVQWLAPDQLEAERND